MIGVPAILDRAASVVLASGDAAFAVTLLGTSDRLRKGAGTLERTEEASGIGLFSAGVAATRDGAVAALAPDLADAAWKRGLVVDLDGIPALINEALGSNI